MRVADHELDPSEAALLERANELAPEALGFAVAHLDAEQLAATIGIDAHGHHHSPGADLHRLAETPVEIGGIEVQVGVAGGLKGAVQEGLHLDVDVSADAAHLRFGDAALDSQGGHQGVDLAR